MPLPSVSSLLNLFIISVLLGAPFPSCLTTEFNESEVEIAGTNISSPLFTPQMTKTWPFPSEKNLPQSELRAQKIEKLGLWEKACK